MQSAVDREAKRLSGAATSEAREAARREVDQIRVPYGARRFASWPLSASYHSLTDDKPEIAEPLSKCRSARAFRLRKHFFHCPVFNAH